MGKNKVVAVSQKEDKVFIVKSVNDLEYNKLLNKQNESESLEEIEKVNQKTKIDNNTKNIKNLYKRDYLLAKSIYDNYVIRGLLEQDDNFEKQWFDFYFKNKELDLTQAPIEYKKILEKVEKNYEK